MNEHLARFVRRVDALVTCDDPKRIATETQHHLRDLLEHPEFLEERFREPNPDRYQQHVVHVHEQGKYSIVSLVWKPGQQTPIHDHRCWCVVGVLQGRELETRYSLHQGDGDPVLVLAQDSYYQPGDVCALVPPDEDIHKVANNSADDRQVTISIHIYGDDIAEAGTSINRVFDHEIVDSVAAGASPLSWRASG